MRRVMEGGCHCGLVRFRVVADLNRVTRCNCSMCTKTGCLYLIVPPEDFTLSRGLGHRLAYHASCLRVMERGRTNYLRLLGADQRALFEESAKEAPGFAFVVRSMRIEFRKPARMDDVLDIHSAPQAVKGASITLCQRVMR